MTLIDIIRRLERIIAAQPNIHTLVRNDVYKLDKIPDVRYGVVAWVQGVHQMDYRNRMATYQLYLYYIDRNTDRPNTATEIVSFGTQILNNIILTFSGENIYIDVASIQPFEQKFVDDCAGAYATLNIQVPIDTCIEDYRDKEIDYNADYDRDFLSKGGVKVY